MMRVGDLGILKLPKAPLIDDYLVLQEGCELFLMDLPAVYHAAGTSLAVAE